MAKHQTVRIGCVSGTGRTLTEARAAALANADRALSAMAQVKTRLVVWAGVISVVTPTIAEDGSVYFVYSNPRPISDLGDGTDQLPIGYCGNFPTEARAASAALAHIIQNLPEIPETLPDCLDPQDVRLLTDLRTITRDFATAYAHWKDRVRRAGIA